MRSRWRLVIVGFMAGAGLAIACTGDDESFLPAPTYAYDAASFDRAPLPTVSSDATTPNVSCGDAGDAPPRLLVVNGERPELAAFNLETLSVDGRYALPEGSSALTSSAANSDPWLVDRAHDVVVRLDAREPWRARGTWDVHDDGVGPSEPAVVVQVSCTKAYVVQRGRDRIAIIDPSQADGGAPVAFVDLSYFRGDGGTLDLSSAVFVPAKKKVFVLAGHVDRTATVEPFGLKCTSLRPSIFAIDVATDAVVSLAGKGAAGSIELDGYAAFSLFYDGPFDRLLAVSAGCHADATKRREIEQVDLATGAVKTLLALDTSAVPTGLTLLDGDRAVVTFGAQAFYWNPHEPQLGAEVVGGVDIAALDGRGGIVGAHVRKAGDAGLDLVSLSLDADAGVPPRVLATDPFSTPGGIAASLEPWPHR